jgi:iron(III) transport system ATP-binding protein
VTLELSAVEVTLSGKRALGPIDLSVAGGEYVVVVGRSGSGKTTLLRTIAGLVRPAQGRVVLGGQVASEGARVKIPPEDRGIGFLFQGGGLWPHLSVARTIDFVLARRNVPRDQRAQRTNELVEWAELRGLESRLPGTLSGGECQRLALARALANDPKILLLDEPLGPLDVELRSALIAKLATLRDRSDRATLHVTHDPAEVAHLATRTIRLEEGRLVAADATKARTGS